MTLSNLFRPFTENQETTNAKDSKSTKPKNNNAPVYPLELLPELIALMKTKSTKQRKLRYLVDRDYKAWFALEGGDGGEVPAHWKMTGAVTHLDSLSRAAGNIRLSDDYTTIESINNKSGDFKQIFDRVKWLLAIFIVNSEHLKIPLAPNLKLVESPEIVRYSAQADELNAWVATLPEDICTQMKDQPQETATRTYTAPQPVARRAIGKNLFASDTECSPTPAKRPRMESQERTRQDISLSESWMHRFQFADTTSKLSTTSYASQSADFSNKEKIALLPEKIEQTLSIK